MRKYFNSKKAKIFIITGSCLGLLILALYLAIPGIVHSSLGNQMNNLLRTKVNIKDVSMNITRTKAVIEGLQIAQPKSFGSGNLVTVPSLEISYKPMSILTDTVEIDDITVKGITLNVRKNTTHNFNIKGLLKKQKPVKKDKQGKGILIDRFRLQHATIDYRDSSYKNEELHFVLDRIKVKLNNVLIGNTDEKLRKPLNFDFTCRLQQSKPATDAYWGACGEIANRGHDQLLSMNTAVSLVGTDLDTFGPLIPKGADAVLGGKGVDFYSDLTVRKSQIKGAVALSTADGYTHSIKISGTPQKPKFAMTGIFALLANRFGGELGNAGGFLANMGIKTSSATIKTAIEAGDNVKDLTVGVTEGLVDTVKNAVSTHPSKAVPGVAKDLVHTVGTATGSIAETGKNLVGGITQIFKDDSKTAKTETSEDWYKQTPERWSVAWKKAKQFVAKQPQP